MSQKELFFRELDIRFQQTLASLADYLERCPTVNLLFAFDIDRTLLHSASGFTNQDIRRHELSPDLLDSLQLHWFYRLDELSRRFPNLLMVYNTAREGLSFENPVNVATFEYSQGSQHRQRRRLPDRPLLRTLTDRNPPVSITGLPMPDAIISGAGVQIDLNPALEVNNPEQLAERLWLINGNLRFWAEADIAVPYDRLLELRAEYPGSDIASNPAKTNIFFNRLRSHNLSPEAYAQQFRINYPHIVVSPLFSPDSFVHSIMFTNVTLNKGTGLRILTSILHEAGVFQGRRTLLITFGDSDADMPMLEPTLEASAVGLVSESDFEIQRQRLHSLGLSPDTCVSWLLSIVFNGQHLRNNSNDYIRSVLTHPKIIDAAPGLGLLGGFESMMRALNTLSDVTEQH